MAYSPKTWTTGETITAAELNAIEQAASAASAAADTANTGLTSKVNSSTYTAGLAAKADTASLAAVAQTGSYTDLANKPTIPASAILTATATKTAAYTAAVGDLAVMNVAGGATTLTLPTAPADKAQVGFVAIGATTATPLTVNRGGSDTIGTSAATSVTVPLSGEVTVYQYQATGTRWLPVANVKPLAALDARYVATTDVDQAVTAADIPFVPASGIASTNVQAAISEAVTSTATAYARKPVFLSAYQSVPTATATTAATFTFRATHTLTQAVAGFRLVMPLGFNITNGQTAADVLWASSTPVKVSVEIAGAIRPVTWQATRTKTADPGGVLVSDLIAADLAAGTQVPVRVNVPTATIYPNTVGTAQGPGATATGDGYTNGSDTSDAMTAVGVALTAGYFAHGLVGTSVSSKPAVAFLGDSITMGTGDATNNGGWTAYASNGTVPNLRLAVGGAAAQGWVGSHTYSWPYLDYCTHALVLLGANDLNTSNGPRTLIQFKADLTTIYTALKNRGLKVYGCTILPRTASTDSWATTANQSAASTAFTTGSGSVRAQVNTWIRAGGGGLLTGYFETADPVESARDSGLWKPSYTTDGAHPTTVAHQAMAANVNLNTLA